MKQAYLNYFTLIFFAFALSSCMSMNSNLDTVNKQLAAAEISWNNTLKLVQRNMERMSPEVKADVKQNLQKANSALNSARLVVKLADGQIDISSDLATVNSSLTVVRTLLEAVEQQEQSL